MAEADLDLSKWRGQVRISGSESMDQAPTFDFSGASIVFYQALPQPFVDGSTVRHEAEGLDDCELRYLPSLSYPTFDYEEHGRVTLWLEGTAYPIDAIDPTYSGYYPDISPVDDWGVTYDDLLGHRFGVAFSHEGRQVDAPDVVTYPIERIGLTSPVFREQLSTADVRFSWSPAPAEARSRLFLTLHGRDPSNKQPFWARCELEDDGAWTPPSHLWDWFPDPILIIGQLRRETACHVPIGADGEFVTVATLQDVGLSFYPTRPR